MIKSLLGDYGPMLTLIIENLEKLGIKNLTLCDHICYRVTSESRYQELKDQLQSIAFLAGEAQVSGRMIAIFALEEPIKFGPFKIEAIELPAPKLDSSYQEGWEHAEFVVPDMDEFINQYPHISFNHKAMNRTLNPELALKLTDQFQVKFHPLPILEVVKKEAELGITVIN